MISPPKIATTTYAFDFVAGGGSQTFTGITVSSCSGRPYTLTFKFRESTTIPAPFTTDVSNLANPTIGFNSPTWNEDEPGAY